MSPKPDFWRYKNGNFGVKCDEEMFLARLFSVSFHQYARWFMFGRRELNFWRAGLVSGFCGGLRGGGVTGCENPIDPKGYFGAIFSGSW